MRDEHRARLEALSDEQIELALELLENDLLDDDLSVYVDEDEEAFDAAIVRLASTQQFQMLREAVKKKRNGWYDGFARGLMTSQYRVDQQEVDEKRGFWNGALWFAYVLPRQSRRRIKRRVAQRERGDQQSG